MVYVFFSKITNFGLVNYSQRRIIYVSFSQLLLRKYILSSHTYLVWFLRNSRSLKIRQTYHSNKKRNINNWRQVSLTDVHSNTDLLMIRNDKTIILIRIYNSHIKILPIYSFAYIIICIAHFDFLAFLVHSFEEYSTTLCS